MAKKTKSQRPTIHDVARSAGVAASTVSHALNNKGYVDADTKARILKHVKALGYRPNTRARNLRTGGTKTISLISTMPLSVAGGISKLGFLMELAAVAAEEAVKRGLALILVPPQPEGSPLPTLEIDGAVLVEPAESDPQLEAFITDHFPVVCLGRWPGHDAIPHVDLLSEYTACLLLDHLKEQGCKRIAIMLGQSGRTSYLETESAYLRFCKKEKVDPIVIKLPEEGGELRGQIAASDLFQRHPDVDGVLALVDAFASGVIQAAQAWGMDIPGRLKVATRYDGLRAKLSDIPLTAVDLHLEEVAAMGVELLAQVMSEPCEGISLRPRKPTLVPRLSSGGQSEPSGS